MNCGMPYSRRVGSVIFMLWLSLHSVAQPDFTASATSGCTPLNILFAVDPSTIDTNTITSIDWYFGFGDTITAIKPDTVTFEDEGIYSVTMIINNNLADPVIKTDYIRVHRTLSAAFRYEEYAINFNYRFIPLDEITDPFPTYFFMWRYDKLNGTDSRANDKVVTILDQEAAIDSITLDTGIYRVRLRVEDTYGCASSSESIVLISPEIVIPNVFAPDEEHFFVIDPQNINTVLHFQVFNRYGNLVFSQVAPVINWTGQNNAGLDLNTGVYFYILESIEGDISARYNQTGFIHLYR